MSIHHINHSFKNEIIIPLLAVEHCMEFTDVKNGQEVITSDKKKAKVDCWEYIHMCSDKAQELVQEIYHCDVWSFIRRWHSCQEVCSLRFLHIMLKDE